MYYFFRVAVAPVVVSNLVKRGFNVIVEENAGALAKFSNSMYEAAGAKITDTTKTFQSGKFYT